MRYIKLTQLKWAYVDDEDYMASQQAEKELMEDRKKYPLFFLKEGIV